MKELDKILEEIRKAFQENTEYIADEDGFHHFVIDSCTATYSVNQIIYKHMNDGWIPVNERLPDRDGNDGELIVTDKDGRVWSGIYYGIIEETDEEPCFHKWDEELCYCYKPDVIAWRPLPDPYRPERSDSHDGE